MFVFFFFKQKTAYEMRISDWSSDVCSSDLLFVSPEYNGSLPPLLKNAIDWASRPTGDEGLVALTAYRGKAAAVMSASISPFGGLRGLMHLRQILSTIQMLVIPEQVVVPAAHRSEEHTSELQSLMRISYAVFC